MWRVFAITLVKASLTASRDLRITIKMRRCFKSDQLNTIYKTFAISWTVRYERRWGSEIKRVPRSPKNRSNSTVLTSVVHVIYVVVLLRIVNFSHLYRSEFHFWKGRWDCPLYNDGPMNSVLLILEMRYYVVWIFANVPLLEIYSLSLVTLSIHFRLFHLGQTF